MFLSLIFSFQNHREYYKNCTTRQPGGLYAPLSVSRYRSAPIFMPYFRRRRHLVRFPTWTFWQKGVLQFKINILNSIRMYYPITFISFKSILQPLLTKNGIPRTPCTCMPKFSSICFIPAYSSKTEKTPEYFTPSTKKHIPTY